MLSAVRRFHLPYPVALVVAGLLIGWLHLIPAPHLTKALLFSVFLPGLLFEAAFHIDLREFWRNRRTICALAVPGVIASAALVAALLPPIAHLLHIKGFSWRDALVFGTLISATDPVAVVGLFRSMGAPRRLIVLVEAEALLNDGTSIVCFTLSLSLLAGGQIGVGQLGAEFLTVVGMGMLIGAAVGAASSAIIRRIHQPVVCVGITVIAAYGAFFSAEALHYSGVIATVVAGMLCGTVLLEERSAAPPRGANHAVATTFWDGVALALNTIVFLLIGLDASLSAMASFWLPIMAAYGVVTLSRTLVIAASRVLLNRTVERYSWRWAAVLSWGGLRGALPMVLALSLSQTYAFRQLTVSMTVGVAVLSILIQGATTAPLLRHLGMQEA